MRVRPAWAWLGILPLACAVWFAVASLRSGPDGIEGGRPSGGFADRGPDAGAPAPADPARPAHPPASGAQAELGTASGPSAPDLAESGRSALPLVRPYSWAATRSGEAIILSGHVPSEAARAGVLAAARAVASAATLDDRMAAARGLDPEIDFDGLAAFALRQLAEMRTGTVALSGDTLSLRGEARDRTAFETISSAIERDLPRGVKAGETILRAAVIAPYAFAVRRAPGSLVLTGYYPDEKARTEILNFVRQRFLSEEISDEGRLAEGAPPAFAPGALFGLAQLAQLAAGEVALGDGTLHIAGEALYEQVAERVRRAIASAPPPGWQVASAVGIRAAGPRADADLCQERLSRRLAGTKIRFEGAGAEISRDSFALLDDLAAIVKRCDARIEVAGHTASGDPERSRELSRERARAVIEHLTRAGIAADRLNAVGYGDTRPLAPNDTDENKAKNARIELLARKAAS